MTGSIFGFVNAIAKNIRLKRLEWRNKRPHSPLDHLLLFGEEDEDALLLSLFREEAGAIRSCLEEMGRKCKFDGIEPSPCNSADEAQFPELEKRPVCMVLYMKFFEKAKDKDVAPLIGYNNIKGVSELRRRCLQRLEGCLRKNFPGLFNF